jgi:hypothetical protein
MILDEKIFLIKNDCTVDIDYKIKLLNSFVKLICI